MEKHYAFLPLFLLFSFSSFLYSHLTVAMESEDGFEEWGYVDVREGAHMFWWHYKSPHRADTPSRPWPIILWLSGGPGSSGTAYGNFYQVGPRDEHLAPREHTWLQKSDLLFVDSPVGTGFSYVEGDLRYAMTDEKIAIDLLVLLKTLFNANEALQKSPLYIFGESYAGKTAAILGVEILKSIEENELKLRLGGVVLGSSFISPLDFVLTWGPLLKDMSRLDDIGLAKANRLASKIQNQLENYNAMDAYVTMGDLQDIITKYSNSVHLHNFLLDHQGSTTGGTPYVDFNKFMNGVVREKLRIIPEDVIWGAKKKIVVKALQGDIMKAKIEEVDKLLDKGINVVIYNGQLDIACSPKGAELWVKKLKWNGLEIFLNTARVPLYNGSTDKETKGFKKSYQHLTFYWILKSGHGIPKDQPLIGLQMVGEITGSPSTS